MGKFAVILELETENIEAIGFRNREEIEWKFRVECANCHEAHGKTISLFSFEVQEFPHTNVPPCNFYMKCKFCGKDMTLNVLLKNFPPIQCRPPA